MDKDKAEDEDIEKQDNAKDEDIGTPSPPPPARFTSVWKAVTASRREALPGIKSAVYDTDSIFLF